MAARKPLAGARAMSCALRAPLAGDRVHFQHGPIDLVIEARGEREEVAAAYEQAWTRFQPILDALVADLPLLRTALGETYPLAREPVAQRMVAACWPHRRIFVTPMAAVAGSVADEVLHALLAGRRLRSAYVNDGGDIALWMAPGERLEAGIALDPASRALGATLSLDRPCGIATSGWRGRSQSLGIADAVTVLADNAAAADAAATLIANSVNVKHGAIRRRPAREVKHDSDLGERLVTVEVGLLPRNVVAAALERGRAAAQAMCRDGLVTAAFLALQGESRVAGVPSRAGWDKVTAALHAPAGAWASGLQNQGRSA